MHGRALARGTLALVAALAAFSPLAASGATLPADELRGLWVVRTALVSPREVDKVVDEAAEAGLNALFVQVRGRGDAFYRSALAPRSVLLERQPREFDPLKRLIERARSQRLQVHAWVNVLLTAHFAQPLPRGHVLERHPEWVMVPRSQAAAALVASGARRLALVAGARSEGDVEGYYLSPAVPAVAEHLEQVVREIVREYPVDGLHLDFIRYPGPSFDYSRAALEGFRRRSGEADLLAGPTLHPAEWDAYRRELLTSLATRLADAARRERPGLVLSAAVVPDEAQAVSNKFQDWPSWLKASVIQAICPMTYTPDSRLFLQQVEAVRERTGPGQPLWAGIAAYRLDVPGIVEKVTLARRAGAQGVVLFSHESLAPQDLRPLRDGAFGRRLVAAPGGDAAGGATGSR